ncbi:MAG: hypothetical protein GY864_15015 [Desulfobacterales bacterium]|nr:hypothetical protein [Desulfobacterales bacterium]
MKKLFIFGFAAMILVAFTMPAVADMKVGGILFTSVLWDDRDDVRMGDGGSDGNLVHAFNAAHSRFKVRWTNDDNVGLYLELGIGGDSLAGASEGLYTRHWYGWWDVSENFTLKVGQTTTCFSPLNGSDLLGFAGVLDGSGANVTAHAILAGYGNVYGERSVQVRGEWDFGPHFLKVALADFHNSSNRPAFPATGATTVDEDTKIPRLDIAGKIALGPVALYPSFCYAKRTFQDVAPGCDDEVAGYGLSFGAKGGFGPATITFEYNQGENWRNIGLRDGTTSFAMVNSTAFLVGNDVEDTESWGAFIDVGIKFGIATLQLRYGTMESENDGTNQDWDSTGYGVSVPFAVAKTFVIRPEIMFYEEEANGNDAGEQMQYGVQFQIVF